MHRVRKKRVRSQGLISTEDTHRNMIWNTTLLAEYCPTELGTISLKSCYNNCLAVNLIEASGKY